MASAGELCVTMAGTWSRQKWCASSWAVGRPCWLLMGLTLGKDLVPFGWMMSAAQGQKLLSPSVETLLGEAITVGTEKMLVWFVQVPTTRGMSWGKLLVGDPFRQILRPQSFRTNRSSKESDTECFKSALEKDVSKPIDNSVLSFLIEAFFMNCFWRPVCYSRQKKHSFWGVFLSSATLQLNNFALLSHSATDKGTWSRRDLLAG